ncbi:protein PFC0760c-like [Helianthus annuus]|uniref:protein PFC0760c-like n=1 Tax=Helianthus annuus TaxID=4232 RepID=UPI000B8FB3D4|nr:protein PFC0760c-like [Helianthus annuus]
MMFDHAYPGLVKDEGNDLLVLYHMDNDSLIILSRYHKKWPEPKTKAEFFGFVKSANYKDPDLVNHLKWRNEEEMKEKSASDELTKLAEFKETRSEWFTKEVKEKKKRGGKRTPKVQAEEGSSSQPQKKRKKKTVETMLVDEPEEDETEVDAVRDQDPVSPETEQLLENIDYGLETVKAAGEGGDDEEKSSSDSEKKRKRSGDDDDDLYVPSPEHVQEVQSPPSSGENIALEDIGDFNFVTDDVVKKLQKKVEEVLADKKKLEKRVKSVEAENSSLLKRLEEEKARRDEQNEYFKLKNKELEANNAMKEHEMYMMNKVLENLIGKSVEQRFEEIEVEEVRARRKAKMEAEMKNKGKGVQIEGVAESILDPCPISSVSGEFDDDDEDDDEDDEENDDDIMKDDADDVYSASSHDDDDDGNNDDDQGTSGIKVTEASNEENVDDYLHDDANEEPENAGSMGEHDDSKNVDESDDHVTRLILHLEHNVEEGEIMHTYTLDEIIKMTHVEDINFKFDFEEELNQFDINQQPEYQYKYVEDAVNYDRVDVEDCCDEEQSENVNVDTSNFPTLVEFFSQANEDELRRKVVESVKNKSFHETSKDEQREERKKWFRKDAEKKFKRLLKYYKRGREVSLGDIIS